MGVSWPAPRSLSLRLKAAYDAAPRDGSQGCMLQRVQESLISRPLACAESLTSLRLSLAARATSSSLPVHCATADLNIEANTLRQSTCLSAGADALHAAARINLFVLQHLPRPHVSGCKAQEKVLTTPEGMHSSADGRGKAVYGFWGERLTLRTIRVPATPRATPRMTCKAVACEWNISGRILAHGRILLPGGIYTYNGARSYEGTRLCAAWLQIIYICACELGASTSPQLLDKRFSFSKGVELSMAVASNVCEDIPWPNWQGCQARRHQLQKTAGGSSCLQTLGGTARCER